MSYKLSGLNPSAYIGVEPSQPPQLVVYPFIPQQTFIKNFNIGTFWAVNNPTLGQPQQLWYLANIKQEVAPTWVQLYPGSGIIGSLVVHPSLGVNVSPLANVLNLLGGTNITTTGTAPNTVTIATVASPTFTTVNATTVNTTNLNVTGAITLTGTGVVYDAANTLTVINNVANIGYVLTSTGALTPPTWQAVGSFSGVTTLTGDTGAAATPIAGNIQIHAGNANIVTTSPGTGNQVVLTPSLTPTFTTITTTNLITTNLTLNPGTPGTGVLYDTAGVVAPIPNGTNGQVLIAGTGVAPIWNTITAGTGVSIANASNNITISATGSGSGATIVTTYSTPGTFTWTPNANTVEVEIMIWNGGSGGGSGRQGASTAAGGGGGAGGGDSLYFKFPRSYFSASETVVVGAGGIGGAAQTSANTNGNIGTYGGISSVGNVYIDDGNPLYQTAGNQYIGKAGINGTSANSLSGGPSGWGITYGRFPTIVFAGYVPGNGTVAAGLNAGIGAPGFNGNSTGISVNGATFMVGGPAGGGGGADTVTARAGGPGSKYLSIDNTSTLYAAAAGGIETGTINGANGLDASAVATHGIITGGMGGGGGGGQHVGFVAGAGGLGGFPGGGGGGGGGSLNGTNSGVGGNGGNGQVIIIEYLSAGSMGGGFPNGTAWTPVLVGAGGGTATYTTQEGTYSRLGALTFFQMNIVINTTTLVGNITITGLPVSPVNITEVVGTFPTTGVGNSPNAYVNTSGIIVTNSTSAIGAGSQFLISGSYLTA